MRSEARALFSTYIATPRAREPFDALDLADGCRTAAVDFLNEVCAQRGKRELAAWLTGSYRELVRFAGEAPMIVGRLGERSRLEDQAIDRLLLDARAEITTTLEQTLSQDDSGVDAVSFAFEALAAGYVVRVEDSNGVPAWAPIAPQRMRLSTRVLALIAADYLTRPEDYETKLAICSRCGHVAFDSAARGRGVCRAHSVSGVRYPSSPSWVSGAIDVSDVSGVTTAKTDRDRDSESAIADELSKIG